MNFDYATTQHTVGGESLVSFKTPKPLVFIAQVEGMWVVFTLHAEQYREYKVHFYYTQKCGSYSRARRVFKANMEFFEDRRRTYGNWPVK